MVFKSKSKTTLVFGSSSSRIFSLLDSDLVKVHTYAGSTIRGLCKKYSTNRIQDKIIKEFEKWAPSEVDRVVLFFGEVDNHLTYFYKRIIEGSDISFEDFTLETLDCYQKFIETVIPASFRKKLIILNVYPPSSITSDHLRLQLQRYLCKYNIKFSLLDQCLTDIVNWIDSNPKLVNFNNRQQNIKYFNKELSKMTKEVNAKFVNINPKITNKNGQIKPKFLGVLHPSSLHVIWETTIFQYFPNLEKITQIKEKNITSNINKTHQKYLEIKEKQKDTYQKQGLTMEQVLKKQAHDYMKRNKK